MSVSVCLPVCLSLCVAVVLGTDDEHVLERLEGNLTERRGYTFYYTRFPRKNEGGASMDMSRAMGRRRFTADAMLNLMLNTHPNLGAVVETSASNWNGMIHELIITNGITDKPPFVNLQS